MSAEKPQPYSYRGDSKPCGHFMRGILENIAQQTDLAQVRGQAGDSAGDQNTHLPACIAFFGIIDSRGEPTAKRLVRRSSGFLERDILPFAALADQVDGSVCRYARNPGV